MSGKGLSKEQREFLKEFGRILTARFDAAYSASASSGPDEAGPDGSDSGLAAEPVDQAAHNFARYLQAARANAGWSSKDLARQTGLSKAEIAALERGLIRPAQIKARWLKALALALNEELDDFALILERQIPPPGLAGILSQWRSGSQKLLTLGATRPRSEKRPSAPVSILRQGFEFMAVALLWVGLIAAGIGLVMFGPGRSARPETVTVIETVIVEKAPETVKVIETVEVEVEKEVIVTVEVEARSEPVEWVNRCTFQAYRMGWVMDYADPNNIVNEVFHPDSPFQYTFWDDAQFRKLVDQALVETDVEARAGLWQQAEEILIDEQAAVLPIYHYDRTILANPEWAMAYPPLGAPHLMNWSGPRQTLIYSLPSEPPSLDINLAADTTSHTVLNQLMESLYRYDAEGNIEPAGATGFEVSGDGTVYTIHLRPDAVWSDGQPVTAQHYVDGIVRLLKLDTTAKYAHMMYYVAGAEAFNSGETDDPARVGVRAINDLTLEITLTRPQSFFDNILALFTAYPVRLDVIREYGDQWTEPGNLVGNGPYTLVEWVHEDSLAVEANPLYHNAGEVAIRRVEFPIITDKATSLAAFENGEVDIAGAGYPPEEAPRILAESALKRAFLRLPQPGLWYIGFNTQAEHTASVKFRQALAHAVDKRSILDNVGNWPWRLDAYGVIGPELAAYQGDQVGFQFDVERAHRLLQAYLNQAGLDSPQDVTIDLWYNRGNEEIIQAVAAQWSGNLGIHVNQINMEWPVYLSTLDECKN